MAVARISHEKKNFLNAQLVLSFLLWGERNANFSQFKYFNEAEAEKIPQVFSRFPEIPNDISFSIIPRRQKLSLT